MHRTTGAPRHITQCQMSIIYHILYGYRASMSVQSCAWTRARARLGGDGGRVGAGTPVDAMVYLSLEE